MLLVCDRVHQLRGKHECFLCRSELIKTENSDRALESLAQENAGKHAFLTIEQKDGNDRRFVFAMECIQNETFPYNYTSHFRLAGMNWRDYTCDGDYLAGEPTKYAFVILQTHDMMIPATSVVDCTLLSMSGFSQGWKMDRDCACNAAKGLALPPIKYTKRLLEKSLGMSGETLLKIDRVASLAEFHRMKDELRASWMEMAEVAEWTEIVY